MSGEEKEEPFWRTVVDKKDLSCEEWREYDFNGRIVRIENPKELYVGTTTHRIVDSHGIVTCCPSPGEHGCVVRWKSRDPKKPVEF